MQAMIRFVLGPTTMALFAYAVVFAQQEAGKSRLDPNNANDVALRPLTGAPVAPQQEAVKSPFGLKNPDDFREKPLTTPLIAPPNQQAAYPYGQQSQAATLASQYAKTDKEDETQRLAVRKLLVQVLTQEFDQHAQQQKKELDALEAEIATLNSQLKKRLAAKEKIIERRFDQLVEEAEGLGWSGPGRTKQSSFFAPGQRR